MTRERDSRKQGQEKVQNPFPTSGYRTSEAARRQAKCNSSWRFYPTIRVYRGVNTVFNEILRSIKEQGNPMGWSHHRVSIYDAVEQGLVERINKITGRRETPAQFLQRLRSECLDEEQWQQEYCCQPADENSAFITWDMITACESPNCLKPFSYLSGSTGDSPVAVGDPPTASDPGYHPSHPSHWSRSSDVSCSHALPASRSLFYVGVDVARKHDLTVIDIGEKIGDTLWDRMRIELHNKAFSEIEHELFRILRLPTVKRCCIDATGIGMQLAEHAKERFRSKVEPVSFTAAIKEELAFGLRRAFEDRRLRIDPDAKLRADLRAIKKTVTSAGNIRFLFDDSWEGERTREPGGRHASGHADRFWAKALRELAAQTKGPKVGAVVIYEHWDSGWSAPCTNTADIISTLSRLSK